MCGLIVTRIVTRVIQIEADISAPLARTSDCFASTVLIVNVSNLLEGRVVFRKRPFETYVRRQSTSSVQALYAPNFQAAPF
jgi:hypothetical protein